MIIKSEAKTEERYGKKPEERSIQELLRTGIVILDKPLALSSHEVACCVKKILGCKKSGHSGTLDPNVSGVLPIALEKATKALPYLARKEKAYVGIIRFRKKLSELEIKSLFKKFTGEITQTPPEGAAVARKRRKRKIFNLKLLEYKNSLVLFHVECEAGTYIRTLCSEMGKRVGGAEMLELRRTRVGNIDEKRCVTLQELSDAFSLWKERGEESELRRVLLPIEKILDLKKIILKDSAVDALCSGASLRIPGIVKLDEGIEKGEDVCVLTLKGELVCIAKSVLRSEEIKKSKKGVAAHPECVLMERGTYPKGW